tara:strand:+ start:8 stop:526 length:519 start_codon:yes stop_codon:yes gene_type:complete
MALTKVIGSGIGTTASLADSNMPAGSVLQVVSAEEPYSSSTTTSNTWVAIGAGASITPSASSSRVFVTFSVDMRPGSTNSFGFGLMRSINGGDFSIVQTIVRHATYPVIVDALITVNYTDSPNTTNAVAYKAAMHSYSGATNTFMPNPYTKTGNGGTSGGSAGLWTLMEIAG